MMKIKIEYFRILILFSFQELQRVLMETGQNGVIGLTAQLFVDPELILELDLALIPNHQDQDCLAKVKSLRMAYAKKIRVEVNLKQHYIINFIQMIKYIKSFSYL